MTAEGRAASGGLEPPYCAATPRAGEAVLGVAWGVATVDPEGQGDDDQDGGGGVGAAVGWLGEGHGRRPGSEAER